MHPTSHLFALTSHLFSKSLKSDLVCPGRSVLMARAGVQAGPRLCAGRSTYWLITCTTHLSCQSSWSASNVTSLRLLVGAQSVFFFFLWVSDAPHVPSLRNFRYSKPQQASLIYLDMPHPLPHRCSHTTPHHTVAPDASQGPRGSCIGAGEARLAYTDALCDACICQSSSWAQNIKGTD